MSAETESMEVGKKKKKTKMEKNTRSGVWGECWGE